MANLKEVKNRINSVVSTQQITKAMKMVAAAKLRRAQDRITQMRPYSRKLSEIISNVSGASEASLEHNPYASARGDESILLVVISSDRGLCGAFNSSVFKYTRGLIENDYYRQNAEGNVQVLTIGKKAFEYFSKRKYNVIDDYRHLMEKLNFADVKDAAEKIMSDFINGKYDKVEIIYNEFKNVATQLLRQEQFLPIKELDTEEPQSDIEYIFEPSQAYIFKELVPKSLMIQFYKTLLESNASEHGARMTAMDKATDNATELLKDLKLMYNRTRQAAITTEILEIVAGAEALAED
jgi:F-type H+-transporting ATPase subunit gamma